MLVSFMHASELPTAPLSGSRVWRILLKHVREKLHQAFHDIRVSLFLAAGGRQTGASMPHLQRSCTLPTYRTWRGISYRQIRRTV